MSSVTYTIRRESRRIQRAHGSFRGPPGSDMIDIYQVHVLRADGSPLVRDTHFLRVGVGVIGVRRASEAHQAVDRYVRGVLRALDEREKDVADEIVQCERHAVRAEKFGDFDDAAEIRQRVAPKWVARAAELADLRAAIGDGSSAYVPADRRAA